MRLHALVVFALVGCGGATPKKETTPVVVKKPDPIRNTAGPTCDVVVEHLATLAEHDATQAATPDPVLQARCTDDKWSDGARNCFATATSDAELDGCKTMLTPNQRDAFATAGKSKPVLPPDATEDSDKPHDKTHSKTRGPVKKSNGGDPCEGGE